MSTPPGPSNRFPGDLFLQVQRDPLAFFQRWRGEFPDYYKWAVGAQDVWVLSRPDLVQRLLTGHPEEFEKGRALQRSRELLGNGLLTAEGEEHLLYRRMMQPAFRRARIRSYADVMVAESETLLRRWEVVNPDEVDIHESMMDLALSVVARTLLGRSLPITERNRIARPLDAALLSFRFTLLPFFSILRRLPLPAIRRFQKARAELRAIVEELVDGVAPDEEDSILSLLEGATRRQKVDQALTILLAGHETTANALTFAHYLLATHPIERKAFQRELREMLGGRPPTSADYPNLKFTPPFHSASR